MAGFYAVRIFIKQLFFIRPEKFFVYFVSQPDTPSQPRTGQSGLFKVGVLDSVFRYKLYISFAQKQYCDFFWKLSTYY